MDPVVATLIIRLVMKDLDTAALAALLAEQSTLHQAHIIRRALGLSFTEAKQVWIALRSI